MKESTELVNNQTGILPSDLNPGDFVDTETAAKILGLGKNTLEIWRYLGRLPKFYKFGGAVRYSKRHLLEYIEQNSRTSTSDWEL